MGRDKNKDEDILEGKRLAAVCESIPANNLAQLLYDISTVCRENKWYKAGLYAFVAAEELVDTLSDHKKTANVSPLKGRKK